MSFNKNWLIIINPRNFHLHYNLLIMLQKGFSINFSFFFLFQFFLVHIKAATIYCLSAKLVND